MVDTDGHLFGAMRCARCDTPLAVDQRYCLECGTRHIELPARVTALLSTAEGPATGGARRLAVVSDPGELDELEERGASPWAWTGGVPAPRTLGIAVLATMAFGIVAGSYNNPTFDKLASAPLLLVVTGHPTQQPASPPATTLAATPAPSASMGSASGPLTITETVSSPAAPTPQSYGNSGGGAVSTPPAPAATGTTPTDSSNTGSGSLLNLPPVKHVFVVMLSGQGYAQSFSPVSPDTYLSRTLPKQGELVSNYYSVAGSSLANAVALMSGQGPTQQTLADCPTYSEISPGTLGSEGQVEGDGCGYPRTADTLPSQLIANGFTPTAYIDGLETAINPAAGCHRPAAGVQDPDFTSDATHPYVSWRNPFAYFDALNSATGCGGADQAPLTRLAKDLASVPSTPALSYIVPSPCEDGSDTPCSPGAPAGLAPADAFLKRVLPMIERSPAYKADGLIAVTFDEAAQSGPDADPSACCSTPAYPNVHAATTSMTSTTDTTSTTGTTTDTTGTTTTATTTDPSATTTDTTGTTSTTATTTTGTTGTTTTTTPSDASTGQTTPTGGGGHVGLLLLSRYVKPGTSDLFDYYNHFSLLATIENLFSLPRLGYAKDPNLPVFDAHIFNKQ